MVGACVGSTHDRPDRAAAAKGTIHFDACFAACGRTAWPSGQCSGSGPTRTATNLRDGLCGCDGRLNGVRGRHYSGPSSQPFAAAAGTDVPRARAQQHAVRRAARTGHGPYSGAKPLAGRARRYSLRNIYDRNLYIYLPAAAPGRGPGLPGAGRPGLSPPRQRGPAPAATNEFWGAIAAQNASKCYKTGPRPPGAANT